MFFYVLLLLISACSSLKLYDKCIAHSECPDFSSCKAYDCNGYSCLCDEGYVATDDKTKCLKARRIGEACSFADTICMSPFAFCIGKCQCMGVFQPTEDGRCKLPGMGFTGDKCDELSPCHPPAACVNNVCVCEIPYRPLTKREFWVDPMHPRQCVTDNYSLDKCNGSDVVIPLSLRPSSTSTTTISTPKVTFTTTETTTSTTKPPPTTETTTLTTEATTTTIATTATAKYITTTPTTTTTTEATTSTKPTTTTTEATTTTAKLTTTTTEAKTTTTTAKPTTSTTEATTTTPKPSTTTEPATTEEPTTKTTGATTTTTKLITTKPTTSTTEATTTTPKPTTTATEPPTTEEPRATTTDERTTTTTSSDTTTTTTKATTTKAKTTTKAATRTEAEDSTTNIKTTIKTINESTTETLESTPPAMSTTHLQEKTALSDETIKSLETSNNSNKATKDEEILTNLTGGSKSVLNDQGKEIQIFPSRTLSHQFTNDRLLHSSLLDSTMAISLALAEKSNTPHIDSTIVVRSNSDSLRGKSHFHDSPTAKTNGIVDPTKRRSLLKSNDNFDQMSSHIQKVDIKPTQTYLFHLDTPSSQTHSKLTIQNTSLEMNQDKATMSDSKVPEVPIFHIFSRDQPKPSLVQENLLVLKDTPAVNKSKFLLHGPTTTTSSATTRAVKTLEPFVIFSTSISKVSKPTKPSSMPNEIEITETRIELPERPIVPIAVTLFDIGRPLHSSCTHHTQCPTHATCRPNSCEGYICLCDEGYIASEDRKYCLKAIRNGERCDPRTDKCLSKFTMCAGVCKCLDFFEHTKDGRCKLPDVGYVGDDCSSRGCSYPLKCVDGICQCVDPFREITAEEFWVSPQSSLQCRPKDYSLNKCNGTNIVVPENLRENITTPAFTNTTVNSTTEIPNINPRLPEHDFPAERPRKKEDKTSALDDLILPLSIVGVFLINVTAVIIVLVCRRKRRSDLERRKDAEKKIAVDETPSKPRFKIPRPNVYPPDYSNFTENSSSTDSSTYYNFINTSFSTFHEESDPYEEIDKKILKGTL